MFCQELAGQLRDLKPQLDDGGVQLVAVSIGTPERGVEFCDHVDFPRECFFADPTAITFDALKLEKSVSRTFFNPATPQAILKRLQKDGAKDLVAATKRWKPWIPPEQSQALQQGGAFVFRGKECVLQHYDQATGDHVDLDLLLSKALA